MMKIKNMESSRTGRPVPNQFIAENDGKVYFQSYSSLIAVYDGTTLTLGIDWDYSVTTLKYLYEWMREYCWRVWRDVQNMDGKSGKDNINKAIERGLIKYDPNMI